MQRVIKHEIIGETRNIDFRIVLEKIGETYRQILDQSFALIVFGEFWFTSLISWFLATDCKPTYK